MQNRWDEAEAGRWADGLEQCVYVSHLLGADSALVLYGGGNTSVKMRAGADDVLYVKGSGSDLAQVRAGDFTPVRLSSVQRLIDAADLSNEQLAQAVAQCVTADDAPRASIETLLHAVIPHRFVLHTHADSILAVTNTAHGERIAADIFGELAPRVPFRESGFDLAKTAHEVFQAQAHSRTIGLILLHHGVFSFGESARSAYDNMLELVGLAEQFLESQRAWRLASSAQAYQWTPTEIVELRRALCRAAGFPMVVQLQDTPELRAFARDPRVRGWWEAGPATPQHAVFVKRKPLFGRDVERYAAEYRGEVAQHRPGAALHTLGLDPAPRVVVDPQLGVWTASVNAQYAQMTAEIFRHDVEIISRASGHDRYAGLPPSAIVDAEIHYGGFEAKARARYPQDECLLGEVALIAADSGASEMARALASRGAEVACVGDSCVQGATIQLTADDDSPSALLGDLVRQVGGLDVLVLGPGREHWLPVCIPLLEQAPRGGRIVLAGLHTWCATTRALTRGTKRLEVSVLERPISGNSADALVQMCMPQQAHVDTL
jgi:rhamnose utilization protein RhaD (predicted bifunctional aldolase and dehydrogenase)